MPSTLSILFCIIIPSLTQWSRQTQYLIGDQRFQVDSSSLAYDYSGSFIFPSTSTSIQTANFISCSVPYTSYITLTSTYNRAQYYTPTTLSMSGYGTKYFVYFDLIFQGGSNGQVQYSFGNFVKTYTYTSPGTLPLTSGFCDSLNYDMKTVNFSMDISSGQHKFSVVSDFTGPVSIKNFVISSFKCFHLCSACSGPHSNECTACYFGSPQSGSCPERSQCPNVTPFYMENLGCKKACAFDYQRYANGLCQLFQRNSYLTTYFYATNIYEINKWSLIYDPNDFSSTPTVFQDDNGNNIFGLFKYKSGLYRYVNEVYNTYESYAISIRINIAIYNSIPSGCGIQFKLNNTYYGSIYTDASDMQQTHKVQLYDQSSCSLQSYSSCSILELYLNVDIPPYPFIFSAVGNYTNGNYAWGFSGLQVSTGFCPQDCSLCEVSFRCKTCKGGYYLSGKYTCTMCSNSYQMLNDSSICVDFDEETPYSKFLVTEFTSLAADPDQESQYILVSEQSGTNFLKGSGVYFSIWDGYRVFGGPFVWAQAKFRRAHLISEPHHSVTISFTLIFGPAFHGSFIYTIDTSDYTWTTTTSATYTSSASVGQSNKIYQKILHSSTTQALNIYWECSGSTNEPVNAYCGFYNYYVAVHYCRPLCSPCSDEYTCSTVCGTAQYFDQHASQCKSCPAQCSECTSLIDCQTCKNSYSLTKLGCTCTLHQYEDTNLECKECPIECSQCLSPTFCIECLSTNNRILENGKCSCLDGYYPIAQNGICQICHSCCLTCSGPQSNNCITYAIQNLCSLYVFNCGNGSKTGTEECDDANSIQYDGCFECKYSCQPQCTKCLYGKCQECVIEGYYLDVTVTPWKCKEKCGDGLLIGNEQCEDLNETDTDGCKNCKYFCRPGCLNCDTNINRCLTCETFGFYPENYYCRNQCGDGILVRDPNGFFIEQCDDGNTVDFDGCSSSCEYQCQDTSICTNCLQNICQQCALGYILNSDENRCELPCSSSCQICSTNRQGCLKCQIGYQLSNSQCYTICGDEIVTADEECDDGNLVYEDGCHQCILHCQHSCQNCLRGSCYQCEIGYRLQNFQCSQNIEEHNIFFNDDCKKDLQYYQSMQRCPANCEICIQGFCESCSSQSFLDPFRNLCIQSTIKLVEHQLFIKQQIASEDVYQDAADNQFLTNHTFDCEITYLQNKCSQNCVTCECNSCLLCMQGYYGNECVPKCGDQIIAGQEQCDDGNLNQLDDCSNCQFNCAIHCISCSNNGICSFCKYGFYLDPASNSCQSICGDKIVADDELCDDGNVIRYDGCFRCSYDCTKYCQNCQKGICLTCEDPYILVPSTGMCKELIICDQSLGLYYDNINNSCSNKCGDGIVAGNEFCDDGNTLPYDGCNDCLYQCNKLCSICQEGECTQCEIGYELKENSCNPICGDGMRLEKEECDDGNDVIRDGCSNCKIDSSFKCFESKLLSKCFKSQENCVESKLENITITCLKCDTGYFLKDNSCIKCSEKCIECENSPNNCITCVVENCQNCNASSGLYFDPISKSCISKCGDGIRANNEQCDDGNQIDQDGCNSKCQTEKQFTCDANGCYVPPQKSLEFTYINSTTKNDFKLTLDDLNITDICNKLDLWVELFDQKEYTFEVKQQTDSNNHSGCDIKFNFFKTIYESNLIHLIVPLVDNASRLLVEETREIVIQPRKVVYYNEAEKAQAQSVVSVSNNLTFLLQLIGPITILLGGFNFFWTILDILAWINNFYFLNVDYPLNVKLFFNSLQWGDVINIPDIITLNSPNDPYYFQAPPKFTEKGINPLFFNNIQLFCALMGLAVLAYFGSNLIVWMLEKYIQPKAREIKTTIFQLNKATEITKNTQSPFALQEKRNTSFLLKFLYQQALWYKTNFKAKLVQVIGLVFLDVCLACSLQLMFTEQDSYLIVRINVIIAAISLLLILYTFKLSYFVSNSHELLFKQKQFQNYYGSLYEGINVKCHLARKYSFINLFRKALFMFLTVFFYSRPLIQTSTCCLACFLNIALIIYENPFETKKIFIQTAIPDFCIFCIILITVLLAIDDSSAIFTFDMKYLLGWVILFFIGLSVFVQMIFLMQQFCITLYAKVTTIINVFRKQEVKSKC